MVLSVYLEMANSSRATKQMKQNKRGGVNVERARQEVEAEQAKDRQNVIKRYRLLTPGGRGRGFEVVKVKSGF